MFFSGLDFFETSAKENINVKQVFDRLVDMICKKMDEQIDGDIASRNGGMKYPILVYFVEICRIFNR